MYVFLPESLEFGCHRLVAVPESLTVLFSRLWLRDLNPEKKTTIRRLTLQNVRGLTDVCLKKVKADCSKDLFKPNQASRRNISVLTFFFECG